MARPKHPPNYDTSTRNQGHRHRRTDDEQPLTKPTDTTMLDESTIELIAQAIDYMSRPENAFGVWLAATGVIVGSHLIKPVLPAL